ncbi:ATP-binding protein [Candidatus Saccharibacteria bacterium]|nr:ATP-binding protein [Candidatus Saccharibacteria bacterium]
MGEARRLAQIVYSFVDVNFMREILDNLIDNALKYTPAGGSVYVNVRGDGDRVLINVTDTGMGISAEDLGHIFQKFYRADNSDTRTIGGTGLGLYLVKQRTEAMGGRVWAESAFGEGSTFFVSLPRLTQDEYEKRMIAVRNQQMVEQAAQQPVPTPQAAPQPAPAAQPAPVPQQPAPVAPAPQPAPQSTPPSQPPAQPVPQPVAPQPTSQPAPVQQPAPQPTPQPAPSQIDINLKEVQK